MQVVSKMPKRKGPSQSNPMYEELAQLIRERKVVRVEYDEVGRPDQTDEYKAQLLRFAMTRRNISVSVVRRDEAMYVAGKGTSG